MTDKKILDLYKKLEELIGFCYEKYKTSFEESERKTCEEYLYDQGEYELALSELEAIVQHHKIKVDEECQKKIHEAKNLMSLTIIDQ